MSDTEKVDDFIGRRFGEGGHLEVIEQQGKRRDGKDKVYVVLCEECAKDPELFGDALFTSTKSNLTKGHLPCGCSRRPVWSKCQYKVMVERKCKELNYEFLGFTSNKVNSMAKLHLKCLNDGNMWKSTSIGNLLSLNNGCTVCKYRTNAEKSTIPDDIMIETFDTSRYAEGTSFRRTEERFPDGTHVWEVCCPTCAGDIYSIKGVGNGGVFYTRLQALKAGQRVCRCHIGHVFSQEQTEVFIKDTLDKEGQGISFEGWVGSFMQAASKFMINCPLHGQSPVSLPSFKKIGMRCVKCRKLKSGKRSGFDIEKPSHIYVLRVSGMAGEFVGYGISNCVSRRLAEHYKNLLEYGFSVEYCETFACSGGEAMRVEHILKQTFKRNPQEVEGFLREATHYDKYSNVLDTIESQINKGSVDEDEEVGRAERRKINV